MKRGGLESGGGEGHAREESEKAQYPGPGASDSAAANPAARKEGKA